MSWSTATLCTDADLLGFEATWLEWTSDADAWRAKAKQQIEKRLRYLLRARELETAAAEVLDLILNPSVLRDAACYMTFALVAQSNMTHPQDAWAAKLKHYGELFMLEMDQAVEMIEFDADESGTIDDSEKYRLTGAVRFTRGGSMPVSDDEDAP
jgi:hypothetical protein